MKKEMDITTQKLIEMFTESTGRNILDSGDAYGRHWQKNQKIPVEKWMKIPYMKIGFYRGFDITISTFNILNNWLEYSDKMTKKFYKWLDKQSDDEYCNSTHTFEKWIGEHENEHSNWKLETLGLTYNEEDFLTQGFQYATFRDENDTEYTIISIHNGCDIRGGYTCAKVFLSDIESILVSSWSTYFTLTTTKGVFDINAEASGYWEIDQISASPNLDQEKLDINVDVEHVDGNWDKIPAYEIFETNDKEITIPDFLDQFEKTEDIPGFISIH